MDVDTVLTELRSYVRSNFEIPDDDPDFTDDVHLFDYGYVDSFGAVDLTTWVQEQFKIEIADSDLIVYPLNTLRGISEFVVKRRNGEL